METLSADDFRKVLTAIEILGRDVDQATFPERAVDAIAAVIDVDMISYNEIDLETRQQPLPAQTGHRRRRQR